MRSAVVAAALGAAGAPAFAQTPAIDPPARIEAGVEVERLRLSYHFANPSSFDTAALVPHFFEQRYEVDNVWATFAARYTAAIPWRTSGGITLPRDGRADDVDTFFQPDASVVTSGTTGDARLRALRVCQQAEILRSAAARVRTGYRLAILRADFGIGHKTVTRDSALVSAEDVGSRERTSSQIHEFFAGVSAARRIGRGWRLAIDGDVSPIAVARLVVDLPDKYPGRPLAFVARAASAHAELRAERAPLVFAVGAGRMWSFGDENATAQTRVTGGVGFILR